VKIRYDKLSMSNYKPPFTISGHTINLLEEITDVVSRYNIKNEANLRLRGINRIRTIQGSLAIEGNQLSTDQITAILEGKPVVAPLHEIQEVRNAIKTYDQLSVWNPSSINDLLEAHAMLTDGLIEEAGKFRSGGVGVVAGKEVIHMAPPADRVPFLVSDLQQWLLETDEHPLIAGSVFHYEFEFIHPFADGNGRMGRLWQTLIMSRWNEMFSYLPVENMIYMHQQAYYDAINTSSQKGDCASFIEFMLEVIVEAIKANTPEVTPEVRKLLIFLVDAKELSRQEIQKGLMLKDEKNVRLRYIKPAMEAGFIEQTIADKPNSRFQKYRITTKGVTIILGK